MSLILGEIMLLGKEEIRLLGSKVGVLADCSAC
jgi:hypothetical protein